MQSLQPDSWTWFSINSDKNFVFDLSFETLAFEKNWTYVSWLFRKDGSHVFTDLLHCAMNFSVDFWRFLFSTFIHFFWHLDSLFFIIFHHVFLKNWWITALPENTNHVIVLQKQHIFIKWHFLSICDEILITLGNNSLMLCLHQQNNSQMFLRSNYFSEYKNLKIYHLSTMWTNY